MTDHDLDIMARTLYGEARGEYVKLGVAALMAVGNVIVNRFKRHTKYGKTLAEVCLKPRQFSCWNEGDPNRSLIQEENLEKDPLFRVSHQVAKKVALGLWPDLTKGSDHYHTIACRPYWVRLDKVRVRLGSHVFYKLDSTAY